MLADFPPLAVIFYTARLAQCWLKVHLALKSHRRAHVVWHAMTTIADVPRHHGARQQPTIEDGLGVNEWEPSY